MTVFIFIILGLVLLALVVSKFMKDPVSDDCMTDQDYGLAQEEKASSTVDADGIHWDVGRD